MIEEGEKLAKSKNLYLKSRVQRIETKNQKLSLSTYEGKGERERESGSGGRPPVGEEERENRERRRETREAETGKRGSCLISRLIWGF